MNWFRLLSYIGGLRYQYASISLSTVYEQKIAKKAVGKKIGIPGPNSEVKKITLTR